MSNESDAINGKLDMLTQKVDVLTQNVDALTQNVDTLTQNVDTLTQNMIASQQNINALREDMGGLRQRVDSFEGTMIATTREGFQSLRNYLDDLNYEVADNGRATRLLKRRVARLERKDED
jgi:uncharacterized coiled-coil DUF342 family protein